ncbi:transcriptional regulator [Pseudoclavibacter endophyticus]|uniref:LysR family transcriptional regulator n=1 Tax=Pseudoclavibacter endophyticus TaxID=1778590 RepID=A0A6H9WN79_9MICO|nr:LysR family transcriptional regulator [Pseudoclavibacter endophyticus]KAB1646695.1 LysR family transcriptional regulator [Pseudoclavibacter endophyticus]GGA76339.1 transcriptional regulator [Pseudoclavibacter endophyticus]
METTVDLNLLRTFVVVYRARNITRAAETLHLSQPAVSHAIRRLREHFDDPLFVRTRAGVTPTRLAATIYADVNGAVSQLMVSTREGRRFDPATSTRRFRLALTDLGEAGLLPRILEATGSAGSGIQIETVPLDIETVAQYVLSSDVDAAIGSSAVPGPVNQEILFHDRYGCLVPEDLDAPDGVVTVDDLRRLPEVRVGPSAGHRKITEAVATLGAGILSDTPHVEVNRFTSLPRIVALCGFFAIVPVDAFTRLIPGLEGTKLLELPFESPRTGVHLISHRDTAASAAHAWFLDTIRTALAGD